MAPTFETPMETSSVWRATHRQLESVGISAMTPNPSIERTCPGKPVKPLISNVRPHEHTCRSSKLPRASGGTTQSGRQRVAYLRGAGVRCGIEARLQEHAAVAKGISKQQAGHWEIKKLGRTIDEAFGLGDSMLIVFINMEDGRQGQFMYAPVSSRLQGIGKRCGDYLHALQPERVSVAYSGKSSVPCSRKAAVCSNSPATAR